ncbi:hypothetical protein TSAR_003185 [Trichomalopsis sarcophagae]|uniref:Protein TsetseEP domain-containing protein n=1 Tax=Trichomalopsis sarcophagae TaxID=543379 RepID=A0A232FEV8_9HYME|nr:hypothetical protein TSAR_003185 [Trichomalopsis sarcophagae]
MKVLLSVVAAFVAINAGPVPVSQLKETAQNVLDVTKALQSEIEAALKVSEEVLKTSENAVEQIPAVVAENEKVVELKEAVTKSGKCQEVFDYNVSKLHETLKNFLEETVDTQITVLKSTLDLINKQLHIIEVALIENLDAEIENCNTEGSECKITGDFIELTDNVFGIVSTSKVNAAHSVTGAISRIQNQVIDEKVGQAVVDPVKACLEA